ncbi:MAG TPA: glycosyltransferase family 2 protein [Roseiflexaceae bacterium]|nr:glycosyltransferase family 2 protein [Roseiflexaceae bacterium]
MTEEVVVDNLEAHHTTAPSIPIPTDDPEAALAFCRQLATLVQAAGASSVAQPKAWTAPEQPAAELSVVIPVYNEADNLPELHRRLTNVLTLVGSPYEIVFVDDGSHDESLAILREMARSDERVVLVELARNFGHQVAISAGLDYARGAGIIVMDADLQDPPEVLPQFIAKWREGHDVVYAIRAERKEGLIKRSAYAAFYRLLQRVAQIDIPLDAGDFCIMDRRVVDVLAGMPERNRFVRGIRSWVGLDQVGLAYERHARHAGKPKYTFSRLIYLALDGLVSFSILPLRIITVMGFVVSAISILLAILYTIQKLTIGLNPPGFATLTVAIFFLTGIQLVTMGVIGEYIGRIFDEVKRRPLYVVRQVSAHTERRLRQHDRRL